ncbi:MAG: peptidase M16 domain-containing protein, partial [Elusimicrobia bacterium]
YYNTYMNGSMSGVIFQEIREARALAYSAGGGYDGGDRKDDENALWGSLGCQADKTVEAAGLLAKLLREPPISEERFAETRKAIEEDYRSNVVNFRSIPGAVFGWNERGLPGDPRPAQFRRVLSYSRKELESFAAKFRGRPLTLYVLGNRERLDLKGLAALGSVQELKLEDVFPY